MKVREYKQQINAKWGTIQDAYTKTLISQLLAYAEALESKASLAPPQNIPYAVSPKGEEQMRGDSYRKAIDFETLSNNLPDLEGPSPGELVNSLLEYVEALETHTN
jgi:hypothetical protein